MARDDFSKRVIETLQKRVAHRCSNPECRKPTIGPGDKPESTATIGIAAHIYAASPGGPRYKPDMSHLDRKGLANGIWLCANCARIIDVAQKEYPPQLLVKWKESAEQSARNEIGCVLPKASDAKDLLATALSGAPKLVPHAVENVHKAVEDALNAFDKRIRVQTAYCNGVANYVLFARERVDFKISPRADVAKEWAFGFQELLEHGKAIRLPAAGAKAMGSPLLEHLIDNNNAEGSLLSVEGPKRSAELRFSKITEIGKVPVCSAKGIVRWGRKSMTFEGEGHDGLTTFELVFEWPWLGGEKMRYSVSEQCDRWSGCDVRYLRNFDDVVEFYAYFSEGSSADVELLVEGLSCLKGSADIDGEFFGRMSEFLDYVGHVREIASFLGVCVEFDKDYVIPYEEFVEVREMCRCLKGVHYEVADLKGNPSCILCVSGGAENVKMLMNEGDDLGVVRYVEREEMSVPLFGAEYKLPRRQIDMRNVRPVFDSQNVDNLKEGDEVRVEWAPKDGFSLSCGFASQCESDVGE